jgi:hypothetical protein
MPTFSTQWRGSEPVVLLMTIGLAGFLGVPACGPATPNGTDGGDATEPAPESGLVGAWEGFIAETPARLTQLGVVFERDGDGWKGSIDIPGAPPDLPLGGIRNDGTELHFELSVGEAIVVFDAVLAAETIAGRVVEGERSFPFELRRLPRYPPPADRVQAWQQDLDVLRTRFLEYDRSFTPTTRAAFERDVDVLEASLSELDDPRIVVALSATVALSGNAHTRLYLLRNRTELRRLPVRLWWFADGLFVIRATSAHRDTNGCRVTHIAGRGVLDVRTEVSRLFAGNESWVEYKSPYFMTSPEILDGLGLIDDMESVPLRFECPGREPFQRRLEPLSLDRKKSPTEAWHDLSPAWQGNDDSSDGVDWIAAFSTDRSVPLYLRNPDRHYWFEPLDDGQTLYVHYNRCQDTRAWSFAEFSAEVEALVAAHPIPRLILDLRFNTGGNSGLAHDFMAKLAELVRGGSIGALYVITGRATFSAGISHTAYLKQASDAILVGEPVGDELDTWSEGGNIVLPNSGLTAHFTNGFHSLSDVERPDLAPFLWEDLDLRDLLPDVVVRQSSDDFFGGRDPALEAILAERE